MRNLFFIIIACIVSLPSFAQSAILSDVSDYELRLDSVLVNESGKLTKIEYLYDLSTLQLIVQNYFVSDLSRADHWRRTTVINYGYDDEGNVSGVETISTDRVGTSKVVKRVITFGINTTGQTIDAMIKSIIDKNRGQTGGEDFNKENGTWDD